MSQPDRSAEFSRPLDIGVVTRTVAEQLCNRGIDKPPDEITEVVTNLIRGARITHYIPQLAIHALTNPPPPEIEK